MPALWNSRCMSKVWPSRLPLLAAIHAGTAPNTVPRSPAATLIAVSMYAPNTDHREVVMTDNTIQALAVTAPKRIPGTPGADAEPPTVARSGNNLFVLWHEFPPGFDPANPQPDVFLARSTNGGTTFQPRINLSDNPTVFSAAENIAVSDSRVYVVWAELGPSGAEVVFRRDRQNDGIFANRITLSNATTGTPEIQQRVQVVSSGNNVFVAWQGSTSNGEAVFFTRSANGGDSFQAPTKVSAENLPAGMQLGPDMTLVANNRVLLAWRDFNTPSGALAEIFYVLVP
jgi:hypothetical protein